MEALIEQITRCPRCASRLDYTGVGDRRLVTCTGETCDFRRDGFPVVGRWPALIDFADSIVAREALMTRDAGSAIDRRARARLVERLRDGVMGGNTIAAGNCALFVAEMRRTAAEPVVLVLGGGSRGAGMEALYDAADITVVSTDIYGSQTVDVIADGHPLPFAGGSFHGVWIQAVLEHVLDPSRVVGEIARVLVPDGIVYAETPFMQQVHEAAFDFTRFTRSGHRWLFRNFEEIRAGNVGGAGLSLLWSMRYCARSLLRSDRFATAAVLPFAWLRWLDRWADERYAADAANGVFFLGRRTAVPLEPRDMIAYYPGPRP